MQKIIRSLGMLALVGLVGFGGYYTGGLVGKETGGSNHAGTGVPYEDLLASFGPGDTFPNLPLLSASGDTIMSHRLLQDEGTVFLFLDPSCGACDDRIEAFSEAIYKGEMTADSVIGISERPHDQLEVYRQENGIRFPIHRDPSGRYRTEYQVAMLPQQFRVDSKGVVLEAESGRGNLSSEVLTTEKD